MTLMIHDHTQIQLIETGTKGVMMNNLMRLAVIGLSYGSIYGIEAMKTLQLTSFTLPITEAKVKKILFEEDSLRLIHLPQQLRNTIYTIIQISSLYEVCELLRRSGTIIDTETVTLEMLLSTSVAVGNKEAVKLLMLTAAEKNSLDSSGETPLYCAVNKGYEDIVTMLLAAEVDKDKGTPYGVTPLHCAVNNNCPAL